MVLQNQLAVNIVDDFNLLSENKSVKDAFAKSPAYKYFFFKEGYLFLQFIFIGKWNFFVIKIISEYLFLVSVVIKIINV